MEICPHYFLACGDVAHNSGAQGGAKLSLCGSWEAKEEEEKGPGS
jgi:hypothetical protein